MELIYRHTTQSNDNQYPNWIEKHWFIKKICNECLFESDFVIRKNKKKRELLWKQPSMILSRREKIGFFSNFIDFDTDEERKKTQFNFWEKSRPTKKKSCNELGDTLNTDSYFAAATFEKLRLAFRKKWKRIIIECGQQNKISVATLFDCLWTTDTVTTIYRHS